MTATQSRLAALVIVVISIAASAFAYMSWRENQVDAFTATAKAALANVDLVLDRALLTVRAVQGLYNATPYADEDDLVKFVSGMGPVSGLSALAFYRRVPASERAQFDANLIETGRSPIGIWQMSEDRKRIPAATAPVYYPATAVYFFRRSTPAYGFDIRSNPDRRFAVDTAIRTRQGSSTDIVTFASEATEPGHGVIFYKPVIVEDEVIGLVSGSIDLDQLIATAKSASPNIKDVSVEIGPLELHGGTSVDTPNAIDASQPYLIIEQQIHSGRVWRIRVSGNPTVVDYARGYGLMTLILLAGLGAAAALIGYTTAAKRGRELQSAETRLRRTLDGLVPLVFMTDPGGRVVSANRAALDAIGQDENGVKGLPIDNLPLWENDAANRDALHVAIARASSGEERRLDVLSPESETGHSVYDVAVRPVAAENGTISHLVVSALDVTERVEAAETERLLMRELDHRMKNTLQVVQGVVRRTAHSHKSVNAFETALLGRITTMARAHDLLAQERWLGADLRTVVLQEIQPFEQGHSVVVAGNPIRINPKGALAFALAIHELGTNALKYGALSVADGRLDISWSFEGERADRRLVFHWCESQGPVVTSPERRGFGSLLLERSITYDLGGRTELEFAPSGVACRIEIPWEKIRPMSASIHFRERFVKGMQT